MGHDLHALYGGCYRRLVGSVFALTGDVTEAEECVQAAFVRALGFRFRFNRRDDPERWLRSAALRIARRRRRKRGDADREVQQPTAAAVMEAIDNLTVGDREVAALGVLAELPATEIATLVGSSPARIDTRLARSRKRLADVDFGLPLNAAVRESKIWAEQAADPPPFGELQAAANRRRRRRALGAAAAALVLVAAAISVPTLVREHRPGPLVPVTQIKFTDARHGYALIQPCQGGSSCKLRIAHTVDGGAHWTQIAVPHGPLRGMSNGIALGVCCGDRLSVSYSRLATPAERSRHEAASDGTIRIHAVSHDNGKTWTSGRDDTDGLQVGPQTAVIPDGWLPLTDYGMPQPTVVAVNAVDDIERPLQHQPNLLAADVSVPYKQNDRIWATGGPTRQELAYSDDQGRSWQDIPAPQLPRGTTIATVFPRPGNSVYVQTRTNGGRDAGPTWRLDSAGDTAGGTPRWTELPPFGLNPNAVANSVLPSGELWISDSHYASWRTEKQGTQVVPVTGPELDGAHVKLALAGVTPDGTIYALEPPGGRQDVVFSSRDDGAHWTVHEIRLPRSNAR